MDHFLNNFKSQWSTLQTKLGVDKAEDLPVSSESDQHQQPKKLSDHGDKLCAGDTEKIRASKIANRVFGIAKKASCKLQEKATNISAIVSERTIIGNIERERQKFMEELRKEGKGVDGIWLDVLLENDEAQQHIISISSHSKNLTEEPPLAFDLESDIALVKLYAEALFALDPRLAVCRFELVPKKVPEDKFWRNYAYRISLVRKFVNEKCTSDQCSTSTTDIEKPLGKEEQQQKIKPTQNKDDDDDDEETLEKELLNDLNEFEVVDDVKNGVSGGSAEGDDGKTGDEELNKQLDELLDSN